LALALALVLALVLVLVLVLTSALSFGTSGTFDSGRMLACYISGKADKRAGLVDSRPP
jgi:hypothetical protein